MPYYSSIPTPEACIAGPNLLRVADYTVDEWPDVPGSGVALLINYTGDEIEWVPIGDGQFYYNDGRDVVTPGTLTSGFKLRYEMAWMHGIDGYCHWGATVRVEPSTPAGYTDTYSWTGDVESNNAQTVGVTTMPAGTEESRTVNVTVTRTRNADGVVVCTAMDTESAVLKCSLGWEGPTDWLSEPVHGLVATISAECEGDPPPEGNSLKVVLHRWV